MEPGDSKDGLPTNGDYDHEIPVPEDSISYEDIEDELIEDEELNRQLLKKWGLSADGVVRYVLDWLKGRRDG